MNTWWARLLRMVRFDKRGLAAVLLLMLTGVGLAALVPWPMKLFVDHIMVGKPMPGAVDWINGLPGAASGDTALLAWLAVATVFLFLMRRIANVVQAYIQNGVSNRMKFSLAAGVFGHLQRLSLRYHGTTPTGDTIRRVTSDTDCVRQLVLDVFLPLATSFFTVVTMVVILWQLDPGLAAMSLAAALPLPLLARHFSSRMQAYSYDRHRAEAQIMTLAEQTLTALPVVQAFSREQHEDERFRGLSMRAMRAYMKAIVYKLQFKVSVGTATALGTAAIMIFGGLHVLENSITLGSLLIFLSYLSSMYSPMTSLAYLSESFADAAARGLRITEILDAEDEVKEFPDAVPLPEPRPGQGVAVRFEDVTFGYEPGRPVLRDISLDVPAGQTLALIGPTGAGKSTLVSLIPRFFDPWQGHVLVNGADIRTAQLGSVRSKVSMVLQEPFLLPLTVAENIAYGCRDASQEEIVAAARAANADGFIEQLPDGYDTIIGERGSTLSGGQRQRLAIARAFIKDSPILILDEPTSALDAGTEALLLEALKRLMADRTTFIIAHRLSTIRDADRILVMDEGRTVETGTHEQLWNADGLYRQLHDLQFREQHAIAPAANELAGRKGATSL